MVDDLTLASCLFVESTPRHSLSVPHHIISLFSNIFYDEDHSADTCWMMCRSSSGSDSCTLLVTGWTGLCIDVCSVTTGQSPGCGSEGTERRAVTVNVIVHLCCVFWDVSMRSVRRCRYATRRQLRNAPVDPGAARNPELQDNLYIRFKCENVCFHWFM